jgi:hypothetical protein
VRYGREYAAAGVAMLPVVYGRQETPKTYSRVHSCYLPCASGSSQSPGWASSTRGPRSR